MLNDQALFDIIAEALRKNGSIAWFEEKSGPIKGRMMITITDIPETKDTLVISNLSWRLSEWSGSGISVRSI